MKFFQKLRHAELRDMAETDCWTGDHQPLAGSQSGAAIVEVRRRLRGLARAIRTRGCARVPAMSAGGGLRKVARILRSRLPLEARRIEGVQGADHTEPGHVTWCFWPIRRCPRQAGATSFPFLGRHTTSASPDAADRRIRIVYEIRLSDRNSRRQRAPPDHVARQPSGRRDHPPANKPPIVQAPADRRRSPASPRWQREAKDRMTSIS